MVFIQTDKPIYTPRQTVRIRVIPLEFDTKPSKRKITVVIMNPQGVRVEQWKDLDTSTVYVRFRLFTSLLVFASNFDFCDLWNSVLPKFSVKLSVPPYILRTDEAKDITVIEVKLTARYTYGKPVVGVAVVRFSIVGSNRKVIPLSPHQTSLHRSGVTIVKEKVDIIQKIPSWLWLPVKWWLQVEADVIEQATGNKETAVDKSCQITSSPYLVEFKNTPKYFKPGLPFVVKVVVTYPNREPVRFVPVKISATGIHEYYYNRRDLKPSKNSNTEDKTNEEGEVEFSVDSCTDCQTITVKVETNNQELTNSQNAGAKYVLKAFDSGNRPLLMVRQLEPGKVGSKLRCESVRRGDDAATLFSYAVISRGRILSHDTFDDNFKSIIKSWSFRVSPDMSPSARLIVYYFHSNGEVIADSILLKIEDSLPTKVEFPDAFKDQGDGTKIQLNEIEKYPGTNYAFRIKAPPGTRLGLLGVDESVYLLRNKNRLTTNRIFKTIENLDLGCGAGGGKDNKDIFKNAGVVFMTDNFVSDGRNGYGCDDDGFRRKRSSEVDSYAVFKSSPDYKICCEMGKENENVTCAKLTLDGIKGLDKNCRQAFWECCREKVVPNFFPFGRSMHASSSSVASVDHGSVLEMSGTSQFNADESKTDEEFLADSSQVPRTDFPEAWIWDEKVTE
ncbi:A.superbus venom factor 2-like [Oculina patagonica]